MKKTRSKNRKKDLPEFKTPDEVLEYLNDIGLTFIPGTNNKIVLVDPERPIQLSQYLIQTPTAARELYAAKLPRITIDNNKKSAFTVWMNSSIRREASGIGYFPDEDPGALVGDPALLNGWCGFDVSPAPAKTKLGIEALDLYKAHLLDVVCSGRTDEFEYLWKWLAWIVQNPAEPPGVAILLYSEQGAGKGHALDPVVDIFRHHGLHLTKARSLLEKFNSLLDGKRLIFADEAAFLRNPKVRDQLKGLITERSIEIERKHCDPTRQPNMVALAIATNHRQHGVEARDRRFFVLEVSGCRIGDYKYFNRLRRAFKRREFLRALLHALLIENLTGFHPQPNRPQTEEHRLQVLGNLPPFKQWLYERLLDGEIFTLLTVGKPAVHWPPTIESKSLHGLYVTHCDRENIRDRTPEHEPRVFGKSVRKALGISEMTRAATAGSRARRYVLPSLRDARRAFEKYLGQPVAWDEDGEAKTTKKRRASKGRSK